MCRLSPLRAALAVCALLVPLSAQFPYGSPTPGVGGWTPLLSCPPLTSGDPGFGLRVRQGTGGAFGLLGLSAAADDTTLAGAPIYVDLATPANFALLPFVLSGTTGAPGGGEAFIPYPVSYPPSLAGLDVYAQAVFQDPVQGNLVATSGLRIELGLPEAVFVGTSVGGTNDPTWLIDPAAPAVAGNWTSGTNNVSGAAFAEGGSRVYVATNLGQSIRELDRSVSPPSWSTFWNAGGVCYGVGVDAWRDRVFTLSDGPTGARELVALDARRGSPTYGQPLGRTSGLASGGFVERFALAPSGDLAAVLTVFSSRLLLVDTDPTSPGFMSWTDLGLVPVSTPSAFTVATQVAFAPDERELVVLLQLAGPVPGEIARYSFLLNGFVDHDLATPVIENIGPSSTPPGTVPSAPTDLAFSRDGGFVAVAGFGNNGQVVRLDLDAGNPFTWTTTSLAAGTLPGAWALSLTGGDGEVAVGTFGGGASAVVFLDALTGSERARVAIPGASNVYTIESH